MDTGNEIQSTRPTVAKTPCHSYHHTPKSNTGDSARVPGSIAGRKLSTTILYVTLTPMIWLVSLVIVVFCRVIRGLSVPS